MIALEVFITAVVIVLVVWVVSNIIRYAMKKSGGGGGWFGLCDAWIKDDENKSEQPKGKEKK